MADFCITAVQYNKDRSHIEFVEVREEIDRGGQHRIGVNPRIVTRAFVADLIRRRNASFQTRTRTTDNAWKKGADVHVIEGEYLTTDKNSTTRDNLGNLPEF